jgi:hypothetical protein
MNDIMILGDNPILAVSHAILLFLLGGRQYGWT